MLFLRLCLALGSKELEKKENSKRWDSILCPGGYSFSRENRSLGVLVSAQLAQLVLFGTAGRPDWGCGGSSQ